MVETLFRIIIILFLSSLDIRFPVKTIGS